MAWALVSPIAQGAHTPASETKKRGGRPGAEPKLNVLFDLLRGLVPGVGPLDVLAWLENRPRVTSLMLSAELDISLDSARQILRAVQRSQVLREAGFVVMPGGVTCCIVYVRVHLVDPSNVTAFEQRLAADSSVTAVVKIAGRHDYRIEAHHRDVASLQAWFRRVLSDPAVRDADLVITGRVIKGLGRDLVGRPRRFPRWSG